MKKEKEMKLSFDILHPRLTEITFTDNFSQQVLDISCEHLTVKHR